MKNTIVLLIALSVPVAAFAAGTCDKQAEADLAQYAATRAEHESASLVVCKGAYPAYDRPDTYAVTCSPNGPSNWQWVDYVTIKDCQVVSVETHQG